MKKLLIGFIPVIILTLFIFRHEIKVTVIDSFQSVEADEKINFFKEINNEIKSIEELIKNDGITKFVFVTSDFCSICGAVENKIKELLNENREIIIYKADFNKNRILFPNAGILNLPMMIKISGNEINTINNITIDNIGSILVN